jgi:hypothetical protein
MNAQIEAKDADLDEIEAFLRRYEADDAIPTEDFGYHAGRMLPALIAELRAARKEFQAIRPYAHKYMKDENYCALCKRVLLLDDGDGRWDYMGHEAECPLAACDENEEL